MTLMKLTLPQTGVYLYENKHRKGANVLEHHHDVYQILYALDGDGTITIEGNDYEFSSDKTVLIFPKSSHSIQANNKLTVLVLAFTDQVSMSNQISSILELFDHRSHHFVLDQFTASSIRHLLRKMLFEQTEYDFMFKYAIPTYLTDILITLARLQLNNQYRDVNEMRSDQIRDYINSHYFENISPEHLATHFGISTRYMNGLFKAKYNMTPLQYLQQVRIDRAKQLLLETEKEIVSICFEIGYETLSTFYRTFNNLVGLSPHKFRVNHYSHTEN